MSHSDPKQADDARGNDASGEPGDGGSPVALPLAARRSLDDFAAALGVTSALLSRTADGSDPGDPASVTLAEAADLLRNFVRIEDPQARARCLAFVRRVAEEDVGR